MVNGTDLQMLTLASVAHRCTQETSLFFQRQGHDPRYCFELFRRAIVDQNQHAWRLVHAQYRALVSGWVERHSAFPDTGEEVQYFVNRAFEKMWRAMPPAKFSRFGDLRSLLRYLQMCVYSAIVDHVRKAELSTVQLDDAVSVADDATPGPLDGDQVDAELHRQEFWQMIGARLQNEQERKVVYGSFVLGLKPRELHARHRKTFSHVKDVYRVKQNLLARLRRDDELRALLGDYA
jgi:DNA-directed RNA polymerase specialized sigma24 family protein